MKNLRLLPFSIGVVLLLVPAAAFAARADGPKAKTMAKYDLNHDGKLDETERAAIRHDLANAPTGGLKHFDADGDGKLSDDEIAQIIPGSGKKSDRTKKAGAETKSGGSKKKDNATKSE
jgi:hypothetical protein